MKDNLLLYLAIKYNGNWDEIYNVIKKGDVADFKSFQENRYEDYGNRVACQFATIFSKAYPSFFVDLDQPPFVIFYWGNINLFNSKLITIVGNINDINIKYLQQLHEYGYSFIYEVNESNMRDASFLMKTNFHLLLYVPDGIESQIVQTLRPYVTNYSVIYSDKITSNKIINRNLCLGREHNILLINHDDYEKYFIVLAHAIFADNNVYKLIYQSNQKIVKKWIQAKVAIIPDLKILRGYFAQLS